MKTLIARELKLEENESFVGVKAYFEATVVVIEAAVVVSFLDWALAFCTFFTWLMWSDGLVVFLPPPPPPPPPPKEILQEIRNTKMD
jgi:hypothetical protein